MIVLGYKHNGVVHMATDTRVIVSDRKETHLGADSNYKIQVVAGEMLLGVVATDELARQTVFECPEAFTLTSKKTLTHRHIVTKIIPALYAHFKERDQLIRDDLGSDLMPCELLLAHKDRLFLITTNLWVVNCNRWASAGDMIQHGVGTLDRLDSTKDIDKQLVQALQVASAFSTHVAGPYVTIDTKDLTYHMTEVE